MRLITSLAPLALLIASPTHAQDWVIDPAASTVAMQTDVFGTTIRGQFSEFDAQITLDPEDLSTARIAAVVYTGSGMLDPADRQSDLEGQTGLDPEAHPEARFVSDAISRTEDGYAAEGVLTIKDTSQPAVLTFSLTIEDGRAVAHGGMTIARSDFNVGASGWGPAAAEIAITLHIEADAAE